MADTVAKRDFELWIAVGALISAAVGNLIAADAVAEAKQQSTELALLQMRRDALSAYIQGAGDFEFALRRAIPSLPADIEAPSVVYALSPAKLEELRVIAGPLMESRGKYVNTYRASAPAWPTKYRILMGKIARLGDGIAQCPTSATLNAQNAFERSSVQADLVLHCAKLGYRMRVFRTATDDMYSFMATKIYRQARAMGSDIER